MGSFICLTVVRNLARGRTWRTLLVSTPLRRCTLAIAWTGLSPFENDLRYARLANMLNLKMRRGARLPKTFSQAVPLRAKRYKTRVINSGTKTDANLNQQTDEKDEIPTDQIGMYVCMCFYGAYNYSALVRQVSGFSNVCLSA